MLVTVADMVKVLGEKDAISLRLLLTRKGCSHTTKQMYVQSKVNNRQQLQWISYYDIDKSIDRLKSLIEDPVIDYDTVGALPMYNRRTTKLLLNSIKKLQKVKDALC